jgi:hypothetical protein
VIHLLTTLLSPLGGEILNSENQILGLELWLKQSPAFQVQCPEFKPQFYQKKIRFYYPEPYTTSAQSEYHMNISGMISKK